MTASEARMAHQIAELEKSLSIAREEQNAMREELGRARKDRDGHKDTTSDGVPQVNRTLHDAPRTPTLQTTEQMEDSDYYAATPEPKDSPEIFHSSNERSDHDPSVDDLVRQNYDLRYKIAQLQDQLTTRDITHYNHINHSSTNTSTSPTTELHALRTRLHATEKESQSRLTQLLSLKSSISSLTRTATQITDTELTSSFTELSNRIREWVLSNFRRAKMDAANLPAESVKALNALTPNYESIEKPDRLALYQALVSGAVMRIFDEPLIVGLSETSALRVFDESVRSNGPEYRAWKRASVRVIENSDLKGTLEQRKTEVLHKIAGEVAHLLFTLTAVNLSTTAQAGLMSILDAAAGLQRTMVLQKARYQVLFFRDQGDGGFDELRMDAVNDVDGLGGDDDGVAGQRRFLFCVFPCLEKFGDEWGENLEVSNVLLRARVCNGVN